jgi:hypothetical protein
MSRKVKISQREKSRRIKQSHQQWEKDNPLLAHAFKTFKSPELFMGRIDAFSIDSAPNI